MILGDGTLHLKLRKSDKDSIWVIHTLFLPQLKNKYSNNLFAILENFLKSFNIKINIINNPKELEIINSVNSSIN